MLLMSWYRNRLRDAFGFASHAYLVNATNGHPLYYLVHAGPNETGVKIASDVLKAGTQITSAGEWIEPAADLVRGVRDVAPPIAIAVQHPLHDDGSAAG
jgi:hypothetical protein